MDSISPEAEVAFERAAPNHTTSYDHMGTLTVGTGCVVEVAADHRAMAEALAEYGFRMVIEHGGQWESKFFCLVGEAKTRVIEKLADEIKSRP